MCIYVWMIWRIFYFLFLFSIRGKKKFHRITCAIMLLNALHLRAKVIVFQNVMRKRTESVSVSRKYPTGWWNGFFNINVIHDNCYTILLWLINHWPKDFSLFLFLIFIPFFFFFKPEMLTSFLQAWDKYKIIRYEAGNQSRTLSLIEWSYSKMVRKKSFKPSVKSIRAIQKANGMEDCWVRYRI